MRTIVHIVVAFAMLFGSFASFNTPTAYSAASPQPELTGTPTETPPPTEEPVPTETVLPTQDPAPTATLPLAETPPPAATPTPTVTPPPAELPTLTPTPEAAPWIEFSTRPAVMPKNGKVTFSWHILQAQDLNASLRITLPLEVTPQNLEGLLFDAATNQVTLAAQDGSLALQAVGEIGVEEILFKAELIQADQVLAQSSYTLRVAPAYLVSRDGATLRALDGRVTLEVPAGALAEDALFTISVPTEDFASEQAAVAGMIEIIATSANSDAEITQFDQPVTIGISYDDLELGSRENGLTLQYFDEELQDWRRMPTYLDTENNIAYTRSNHLTIFGMDVLNWQAARLPTLDSAQTALFTGAGTYSMSFWMPPGPGGLQPSLALSYNSQVVDQATAITQASYVGMGWSLDTGSIERDFHGTMDYVEDDTFSINTNGVSDRLLPGTDGYYHTASESFWRIQWDTANDIWYAWDKTGTKYTFGGTTNSKNWYWAFWVTDAPSCDDAHHTWRYSLSRVENSSGKYLDYTYQKDIKVINDVCDENRDLNVDIASYPLTITYPNNRYRVSFVWAEGRKDIWGNWITNPDIQVFYQKKSLDKLQVLQDTNGDGVYETVIRAYDFTYLDDSSLENIFPNMLWNPGASEGRTLTLYSVQEKGLGESQSLPATTFEYDGMHLENVNNGYNGAVKFTYQQWSDTEPAHHSESAKWLEDINNIEIVGKALPIAAACTGGGNWKKWSEMSVTEGGEAWCCNGNGICFRHTATVPRAYRFKVLSSGYVNARREWVRPGGVYFLSATVEKVGTTEPVTNAQIALFDTWPVEGDYTTPALNADGVITKTFEWEKTRSHNLYGMVRCEHCKLTNFDLYLLPSFYRVTEKVLYANANASPLVATQTWKYDYEGTAMNTTANSAMLTCEGDCYYDPYTEFRGHSQVTETAPDGHKTVTYFGQEDTDKGKVLQVDVLTGAGALLNRTLYTYEFNAPIAANASLLPHSGSNVYNELTITWPRVTQVETHINEGNAELDYAGTRTTYAYDTALQGGTQYGNLTNQVEYEYAISTWTIYRASKMRYYPNSGAAYLVGLPAYQNQYACPQNPCDYGAEDILSSVVYFYDSNTDYKVSPTTGKLAYQRTAIRWGTQYTVAKYQDTGYLYDAWGNLTTTRAYKDEKLLGDLPGTGTNYQETTTCYGTGNPNPSQLTCTDDGYNTYPFWVKNSLGHVTSFTYDKSKGVPLSETDPNNVLTSAEYDGFGRLLKLIRQGDSSSSPTVQISYHDTAEKFYTEASQKLDASTHFVMRKFYDGLGRPIQTQVVGAEVEGVSNKTIVTNTEYSYNTSGLVTTQYVPYAVSSCAGYCAPDTNQPKTTTQYDALGRVLWVREPQDGSSYAVQNSYTVNMGNCLYATPGDATPNRPCSITSSTDRSGTTTQSLSSARGLTGRVHPAAGPDVNYFYDAAGHLTTARYGTASTNLTYDLAGRKTSMTDPDMGHWTYTYDALGNLTGQTDARACTTSLTYDGLNRLTGKSYTGTCSTTTTAVSYFYDAGSNGKGHRTGMTDASGGTTWTYDTRGRVFTELWDITGPGSFKTQWTYNSADQVKTIRYPAGNDGTMAETVTYNYLPQMTLDTTSGTNTYVSDTRYDAEGRMTQMTRGSNVIRTSYGYFDWTEEANGGRLETLESLRINVTPNTLLQSLTYAYDDNGNILSIVDPLAGGTQTQTFGYDALNRLTSAQAVGGNQGPYSLESYTYNAQTGNLASKAGVSYTYADTAHKHAVTSLGNGNAYTYDANGNQITRLIGQDTFVLIYDGENHLTQVKKNNIDIASFVYNGDGARVQSTLNGVVTAFVGNRLEWTGSATTMKKYYYAGSTRVAMRTGSSTLNFILGDHLGSTSLTTSGTGDYQSETLYKPWGEVRYPSGTLPPQYTFTGQYSNVSDFGLMYYGARWYDVSLGRFASADTDVPESQDVQVLDRYIYVGNNPLKHTDASGHCWGIASGLRGLPIYNITCQNLDTALSIVQHPEANFGEKALAGGYIVLEAGAHAALAVGAAGLACAVAGPSCVTAVEGTLGIGTGVTLDGDPTNEVLAVTRTAESVVDKLTRYLLNPNHPRGSTMAIWYEKALGYTQENIGNLAKQIVFDPKTAYITEVTQFGTKYNQIISITGANGKVIDIVAAWIELADGTIKLVTTIPGK